MFLEGGGQLIRDERWRGDRRASPPPATPDEVDDLCAIAGIRAAGFKTDDDFDEGPPPA